MSNSLLNIDDALPADPKERMAQLSGLARLAEASERFEDMCKFMKVRFLSTIFSPASQRVTELPLNATTDLLV